MSKIHDNFDTYFFLLISLYPFFTLFIFGEVFFSAFITFLDWWAFTKEKNNFFDFGWFGDVFYVKKEESE